MANGIQLHSLHSLRDPLEHTTQEAQAPYLASIMHVSLVSLSPFG